MRRRQRCWRLRSFFLRLAQLRLEVGARLGGSVGRRVGAAASARRSRGGRPGSPLGPRLGDSGSRVSGSSGSRARKYLAGRSDSLHRWISTSPTSCSSCAIGPAPGPGQGEAPGPGHRQGGRLPGRPLRGVPRRRAARAVHPGGVRGLGGGDPGPGPGHRGGGQVLQHGRPHAAAHPPAHRAGDDRRHRGTEEALPARDLRRVAAGRLRAVRAPGRQRRHGDADPGRARRGLRRGLGPQRHQVLDVGGARGGLVHRLRQDQRARPAGPTTR